MFNYNQSRSFEQTVVDLQTIIQSFPSQITAMNDAELSTPLQTGKWSRKQICGHLVDSALNNLQRFLNIKIHTQATPLSIIPYPQEALVEANAYQSQRIEDILAFWKTLNLQIVHVVSTYSIEERKYLVDVQTENAIETIEWWLDDYVGHLEHHLKQIGVN